MADYSLPIDVLNRAAQHLGIPRIYGLTDSSTAANELNYAYDKIRQYELQRNLWVFATRESIVRAVRNDTMLIQPAIWNTTTAYTTGDIVGWPQGTLWIANSASTNVPPGNAAQDGNGNLVWESYFGPMTAEQFQPTAQANNSSTNWQSPIYPNASSNTNNDGVSGYNAGELVYIPKGDGTAVVYQALEDTEEAPWYAKPWDSTYFYKVGDIAGWPSGDAGPFDLGGNNTLNGPNGLGSNAYISTSNLNIGNDPTLTQTDAAPPTWNATTQYVAADYVVGSDNQVYLCVLASFGDANLVAGAAGYNPVTDYGNVYWQPQNMYVGMWSTAIPAGQALSNKWQVVQVSLVPIVLAWPLGAGPAEDTFTMNIYRLPANWLRLAPDNPKTGITPWLGGPTFVPQRDWVFYSSQWMVSSEVKPVRLRYIADFQDVSRMDAMFCEAFALSMAQECASACDAEDHLPAINQKYRVLVVDARSVNAIEIGPVTPPDDQFITVRY